MLERTTRQLLAWSRARARELFKRRGDEGNIVAVAVLMIVLVALAGVAVAVLPGGFTIASSSQQGEQAVAQANDGLRDATFRLDQMGDSITNFCAGSPPSALLAAAGLTAAQCSPSGRVPLANAPGLVYYLAVRQASVQPLGVTDEVQVTSYAVVGQQKRTVTATLYRVANDFGFFGVSGFDDNGALKQATVAEVGNGGQIINGAFVDIGVGPGGNGNCLGNTSGSKVKTLGGSGSNVSSSNNCPQSTPTYSALEPQQVVLCQPGQASQAFNPCIDTTSFATDAVGIPTCPLPSIPAALLAASGIADDPPAHPSSFDVYDCSTQGQAVTISATSAQTVPPGNYYLDANNVTVNSIDPAALAAGPVSLYVLPLACGGGGVNCPIYVPPSSAGNVVEVPGGSSCSLPPGANANVSLSIPGKLINYGSTGTPGNPANFALFWSGNNSIAGGATWFDGYLYAPGAILVNPGNGQNSTGFFGTFVLNCWQVSGSPNLIFATPIHVRQYLTDWVAAHYQVTP